MNHKNQIEAIATEHFDNMKNEIQEEMAANIVDSGWYMASSLEQAESNFIKLMHNVIEWQENTPTYKQAWIRADIVEKGLAVPVGDKFYGLREPLSYQWLNDETFQVFFEGSWQEAHSIDWDFLQHLTEKEMNKSDG